MSHKLKLKHKLLHDQYYITSRHLICKFMYLYLADEDQDPLPDLDSFKAYTSELINTDFYHVYQSLKEWHKHISKVSINCKDYYILASLDPYPHLDEEENRDSGYPVIEIRVRFDLIRQIDQIEKYGINLAYLKSLLFSQIEQIQFPSFHLIPLNPPRT